MSDYGIWSLVIVNTAVFAVFAASFFHPRSRRDWRAMGAYTGFLVALFTEMYGFPLTISLLSGPLGASSTRPLEATAWQPLAPTRGYATPSTRVSCWS